MICCSTQAQAPAFSPSASRLGLALALQTQQNIHFWKPYLSLCVAQAFDEFGQCNDSQTGPADLFWPKKANFFWNACFRNKI